MAQEVIVGVVLLVGGGFAWYRSHTEALAVRRRGEEIARQRQDDVNT